MTNTRRIARVSSLLSISSETGLVFMQACRVPIVRESELALDSCFAQAVYRDRSDWNDLQTASGKNSAPSAQSGRTSDSAVLKARLKTPDRRGREKILWRLAGHSPFERRISGLDPDALKDFLVDQNGEDVS